MAPPKPAERFVIVHADPLIGRTVAGRFRVQALVARGATGRVYRCEQLGLQRPIALKILDATGGDFDIDSARERFAQEATALARLTHENTVRVVDAGSWEGIDYLAMEYVAGQTLKQRLERGRLPPALALSVARQICASLAEAHGAGLVHRDLKPGNVLLTRKDDGSVGVKVVDFGLVKQLGAALDATLVGRIVGSPLYMAPEQIRGGTVDGRSDLYALGGVLFHMLTGRRPFTQDTTASVLMAHLMTAPPLLCDAMPDARLPPALDALVQRCLAKDPLQRFGAAGALDEALAHCAQILDGRLPWEAPLPGGALPPEFRFAPPAAARPPQRRARPGALGPPCGWWPPAPPWPWGSARASACRSAPASRPGCAQPGHADRPHRGPAAGPEPGGGPARPRHRSAASARTPHAPAPPRPRRRPRWTWAQRSVRWPPNGAVRCPTSAWPPTAAPAPRAADPGAPSVAGRLRPGL